MLRTSNDPGNLVGILKKRKGSGHWPCLHTLSSSTRRQPPLPGCWSTCLSNHFGWSPCSFSTAVLPDCQLHSGKAPVADGTVAARRWLRECPYAPSASCFTSLSRAGVTLLATGGLCRRRGHLGVDTLNAVLAELQCRPDLRHKAACAIIRSHMAYAPQGLGFNSSLLLCGSVA